VSTLNTLSRCERWLRHTPDWPALHDLQETIGILKQLVEEGKFDHIGISEVSAQTLRRVHAVSDV